MVTSEIEIPGRGHEPLGMNSPLVVKLLEDAVGTDLRAPGFPAELAPE